MQITATMNVVRHEAPPDAYRCGGIIVGTAEARPKTIVLGDSHGSMWSHAIRTVIERYGGATAFISIPGATPFVTFPLKRERDTIELTADERYEYDLSRLNLIRAWKPDLVIVCSMWRLRTEEMTHDLLSFLDEHAAHTLLMEQPPELAQVGNRNALQYAIFSGMRPEPGVKQYWPIARRTEYEAGRELIRVLAANHKNCGYIPIADLYLRGSDTLLLDGKCVVYTDFSHLTAYGSLLARDRIEQSVADALRRVPR